MKTMTLKAVIALVVSGALGVAGSGVAVASEVPADTSSSIFSVESISDDVLTMDKQAAALYMLFNYYDQIPDEVLIQGDVALQKWQQENPVYLERASVVGCIGALAWLIGSNVVGAAKILRIKNYIKALGGLKEAVKLMWGASFQYEKMREAGGALAGLGAELLGITQVKDKCFS